MNDEAYDHYNEAQRIGRKYVRDCAACGKNPYPQILEDVLPPSGMTNRMEIGVTDIPSELIIGTCFHGRTNSFAGNFMPLMPERTEFHSKWVMLCAAHLGDTGIRDPITCFEYMGKFYVQEGNKRVSVLKSYDAPLIPGKVTRILPEYGEDEQALAYFAFTEYFRCSKMYDIQFPKAEMYGRFLQHIGIEPEHIWTESERQQVRSAYYKFKNAYMEPYGKYAEVFTPAEALMVYLDIYPFDKIADKSQAQLQAELKLLEPQMLFIAYDKPADVLTQPVQTESGLVRSLISSIRPTHLNVSFIHSIDPELSRSEWAKGHDLGRLYLEERLGSRVTVKSYVCNETDPAETMEQAVQDGAQLMIVTAPTLIDSVRRVATAHPALKVLICALSLPFSGVRTYYSRSYEAQFIAGAIAGAVTENGMVGYIARSPVMGVIADINAFALGLRMTRPNARVKLEWTSLPGDPEQALRSAGCDVIANRSGADIIDWALYRIGPDGTEKPLSFIVWNWGRLYEQMVNGILNGAWDAASQAASRSINYWWGMDTNVIDIVFTGAMPDGVRQMAKILKNGTASGSIDPFGTAFCDNSGNRRCNGKDLLSPDAIMRMDYLAENIDGRIPKFDELLPMARAMTALMSVQPEAAE